MNQKRSGSKTDNSTGHPLAGLLRTGVYSNLFIAACAVLMAWQTGHSLLRQDAHPDLIRFIFFATLCSYSFHYYFTTRSEIPSPRISWTNRHQQWLLLFFLAGLAGSVYWFTRLWEIRFWLLPAVAASFLYSAPKVPHPLLRQLRKVAIGKTIFLAFTWMYVTAVLPLAASGQPWTGTFTLYVTGRYFFIYAVCILFDYRDRDDDKKNGVRSLITFLSERNIDRLFLFSIGVYFLMTFLLFPGPVHRVDILCLLVPGIILAFLYRPAKQNFSDTLYYVVLDGLMALPAVLMLVARI